MKRVRERHPRRRTGRGRWRGGDRTRSSSSRRRQASGRPAQDAACVGARSGSASRGPARRLRPPPGVGAFAFAGIWTGITLIHWTETADFCGAATDGPRAGGVRDRTARDVTCGECTWSRGHRLGQGQAERNQTVDPGAHPASTRSRSAPDTRCPAEGHLQVCHSGSPGVVGPPLPGPPSARRGEHAAFVAS